MLIAALDWKSVINLRCDSELHRTSDVQYESLRIIGQPTVFSFGSRDRADIRENWVYTPAELEKLADYLEEESPRRDTNFHLGPARALGHSGTAGTQLERAS